MLMGAVALVPLSSAPDAVAGVRPVATISVDFGKRVHVGNALGFMHGGLKRLPVVIEQRVESRASQLLPGIWRGVPQSWSLDPSIVRSVGAEPVIQLGDIWGLPGHWPKVWPDQNLTAYAKWVQARAANIKAWFPRGRVWVDIWNEPDSHAFWPIHRDPKLLGYFSAFRVAERTLRRSLGPRVRIIGPSTASNASMWTGRLVRYCAQFGCRIDGIAWHANFQKTSLMEGLGGAMQRLRARAQSDPRWRRVVRQPADFLITEYVSSGKRTDPGALLSYWSQIEKGGGAHAAFSVWKVDKPSDGLLDSLLDSQGRPRDSWWAARAYALGRTTRVRTATTSARWPALAASSGIGARPEVLVGSWGAQSGGVNVCMSGLKARLVSPTVSFFTPSDQPWVGRTAGPHWQKLHPVRTVRRHACVRVLVPAQSVVALSLG